MNTYGYIRVSATDQNEERQVLAMLNENVPVKNIYMDKQSGILFQLPVKKKSNF